MSRNKSAAYGYYGGGKGRTPYTPPVVLPEPTPVSATLLTQKQKSNYELNQETRNLLESVLKSQSYTFLEKNAPNILVRQTLSQQANNVDTFVMSTSAKPEDVIIYTSYKDTVVLSDLAADGIKDDIDTPVDAGFF